MARFVVYENPNKATKKTYPYLLDIQSNLLDDLRTTVVIPMLPESAVAKKAISELCPVFEINGKKFIALTQQLAGIDRNLLGKEVCNLAKHHTEIVSALDFIISGI